ncbi:MAG: hypothetical protein ACM3SQ_03500 [Betaproteobacteria bacterium]
MRLMLGILLLSLLPATAATAKPKHWHDDQKHWNKHWRGHDDDDDVDHRAASCYFEPRDVRIMREYYEPRYRSLPPGLAKKYYRTGHLPPGWERKMEALPVDVERQLVVLPRGYRRGYIDGSVVVYSPRTQVVIDVVALFGR